MFVVVRNKYVWGVENFGQDLIVVHHIFLRCMSPLVDRLFCFGKKMIEISNYKILPNVHVFTHFSNSSKSENKIEFWRFYISK
jgi:hypothetical protein